MYAKRKILSLALLGLSCLAQAGESWKERLETKIRAFWPGASRVHVQIMGNVGSIPPSAEISILSTESYIGLVPVQWKWEQNGLPKQQSATVNVQVRARVAVAKTPLSHGQAITEDRIAFVEHEIGPLSYTGFFRSPADLERRKAKGYVSPGSVLCLKNTTAPLLVERGQTVKLVQKTGPLQLVAQMESLESGAFGEWVKVAHPKTHKVVRARVIGIGETGLN